MRKKINELVAANPLEAGKAVFGKPAFDREFSVGWHCPWDENQYLVLHKNEGLFFTSNADGLTIFVGDAADAYARSLGQSVTNSNVHSITRNLLAIIEATTPPAQ